MGSSKGIRGRAPVKKGLLPSGLGAFRVYRAYRAYRVYWVYRVYLNPPSSQSKLARTLNRVKSLSRPSTTGLGFRAFRV